MIKNLFTAEQVLMLRENPYTYRVDQSRLAFTKEFKELFYSEYQAGTPPRKILEKYGYDPVVLGQRRVWGISGHIREQYNKYGGFHEGSVSFSRAKPASSGSGMPVSEKEELKQLRHEVDYLKQEVAFLKKISSIRTTRK